MVTANVKHVLSYAFTKMMESNPRAIAADHAYLLDPDNVSELYDVVQAGLDPSRKLERVHPHGAEEETRAVDMRTHKVDTVRHGHFIGDDEIISVITHAREFDRRFPKDSRVTYGRTPFMRAVVHQAGTRGCMAACSAMMCLDHRISPDWEWFKSCSLTEDDRLMGDLRCHGLIPSLVSFPAVESHPDRLGAQLEHLLRTYYSGVLSIGGEIGSHVVMLDFFSIKYDLAVIREPFHGWCIAVRTQSIFNRHPDAFIGVKPLTMGR